MELAPEHLKIVTRFLNILLDIHLHLNNTETFGDIFEMR